VPPELGGLRQDRRDDTSLFGSYLTGTYYVVPSNAVAWFAELSHEQFSGSNAAARPPQPKTEPNQTRLSASLALQDQAAFFAERLILVPTLRYAHLSDRLSPVDRATKRPSGQPVTSECDLLSPSFGALVRVQPWLSLKGNIGRFERAPNFTELFYHGGNIQGRGDLQTEKGVNRDIGLVATYDRLAWLSDLNLEYVYFNNHVDNLIALVQLTANDFVTRNVGSAQISGHELSFDTKALDHLGLTLNYTHQDAENQSDNPNERGKKLPGRPADELYTRLEAFNGLGKIYYELNFVSGNFTDAVNFNPLPSRAVHNFGIAAYVGTWLVLGFEADNVTDNQISDVGGFPLPGRSFFGTVKVRF
jgi:vitamin B12 transporter